MTALITREPDLSRLLVEAAIQDIERMERLLTGCNLATDPHGYRGAALEADIVDQQAIALREASALLGVPFDRLAKAVGI